MALPCISHRKRRSALSDHGPGLEPRCTQLQTGVVTVNEPISIIAMAKFQKCRNTIR